MQNKHLSTIVEVTKADVYKFVGVALLACGAFFAFGASFAMSVMGAW